MKTSVILMLLLLLLACNEIQTSEALSLPNFYPFGQSEGDLLIPQSDDGSSGTVSIPIPFRFFDQNHYSLFVNTNGVISFLVQFSQHSPNAFPLGDNHRLVAPFWADVNTNVAGEVFYRGTTDATLLHFASNDVIATFADHRNFRATWVFVATWYKVAFYGAKGSYTSKRNTFQAVLITNGRHSFAIFNYNKITWTTGHGTSSSGDSSGLGGKPAQVGFNAGRRYFNIPGSGTHQVINLPNKSNVKNTGRWMYRIDRAIIQADVCNTKGGSWTKLSPTPVCFGAKGDQFGKFSVPCGGELLAVKLVHQHGYVTCSTNSLCHRSNWGCGCNRAVGGRVNVVITTSANRILLPASQFRIWSTEWSRIPGYNSQSPELVLSVSSSSLTVTSGQELRLWYGEDLVDSSEGNNGGKSCCEVFARFK